ncbi:MAG: response regulator [Planctomycetota bacterium]|jgi:PAS domain S-box-containing protein
MRNWSISRKLIGLTLVGVIGTITLLAWISVTTGASALLDQQTNALEAVRSSRRHYIETYFKIIHEQMFNFSQNRMISEATEDLTEAYGTVAAQVGAATDEGGAVYQSLEAYYTGEFAPRLEEAGQPDRGVSVYLPESAAARILQAMYIADNPHPVGAKLRLDRAEPRCDYNRLHAIFHPRIRDFLESFGYYDIFLFDLDGNLIYSVFKETDFATDFLEGPYKESNFARVYREARGSDTPGSVFIADFMPYEPSYGAPASFIGSPVFREGRKIGVAIFQMPVDEINRIMGDPSGLARTEETYVVADDLLMRTNSRFTENSTIFAQAVDTEAARRAISGASGTIRQIGYRGPEVLSSYAPLDIEGLNWAILAEIEMAEIIAPVKLLRNRVVVFGAALAVIVVIVSALGLRRLVIAPVQRLAAGARRVDRGDYATTVDIATDDEMGDLAGAFNRMTASIRQDIEDRRKAADELRKLTRAVEQSSSIVVITDPQGRIEYTNPKFSQVTGYTAEEVIGANPRILKSGKQPPEVYADLWGALTSGREWHGELCNKKKDGQFYWVMASMSPIRDPEGATTHLLAVSDDITDRKEAEEELHKARAEAEAANRAKSAFLANMSHELRTPMNAIIGYSEMLMEEAEDLEQEEFIPDLKKIHGAGRHLLSLINDILDLSKIEAGKMELFLETFELAPMIDDVTATVDALVKKKYNTFKVECGDNLGAMHADMTKLRQSLFNLISNAAKFTENGTITLSVDRERCDSVDWVSFHVADTGIGIAPDKIGKLFEEFTQADASTTRKFGGTGLGLAITRRFCRMMGGDVTAESTLGAGTTFAMRLPAEVKPPATEKAEAGQPAEAEAARRIGVEKVAPGRCILVIDDDSDARDLIERSLTKDGFEVVTAPDGDEGLRLARELKPAAITLDVMMPGTDGWAVLRELKSDPQLLDTPVIMVSMIDDKSMGYTLGAAEYLTKPVDRGRLVKLLHKYRCANPPCRVLLVEDDPDTREMMRRTLEKEGWVVAEAGNGQEALESVKEHIPDLIVLDLMMPVMDGFQFTLELRKVEAWRDIPITVVTAKDLTDQERKELSGEVEMVLEKGAYSREQLLEQVRDLVTTCSHGGEGES